MPGYESLLDDLWQSNIALALAEWVDSVDRFRILSTFRPKVVVQFPGSIIPKYPILIYLDTLPAANTPYHNYDVHKSQHTTPILLL